MAIHAHITGALPVARLYEVSDLLSLALDATERPQGYSQDERESRSYIRTALRHVNKIVGAEA